MAVVSAPALLFAIPVLVVIFAIYNAVADVPLITFPVIKKETETIEVSKPEFNLEQNEYKEGDYNIVVSGHAERNQTTGIISYTYTKTAYDAQGKKVYEIEVTSFSLEELSDRYVVRTYENGVLNRVVECNNSPDYPLSNMGNRGSSMLKMYWGTGCICTSGPRTGFPQPCPRQLALQGSAHRWPPLKALPDFREGLLCFAHCCSPSAWNSAWHRKGSINEDGGDGEVPPTPH